MGRHITEGPDGLTFVPVRGKMLSRGYHLARRKSWGPEANWHIVYIYVLEDGSDVKLGVFQAGSVDPEHPRDWIFRSKIIGIEHLPPVLPPHPRVALAEVLHSVH